MMSTARDAFKKYGFPVRFTLAGVVAVGAFTMMDDVLDAEIDTERSEYSDIAIQNFEKRFTYLKKLDSELVKLSGNREQAYADGDNTLYDRLNRRIESKSKHFEEEEEAFVTQAFTNIHLPEDVLLDYARQAQDLNIGDDAHWGHYTETGEKIYVDFTPSIVDAVQECRVDFARSDRPIKQSLTNAREVEQCAIVKNQTGHALSGLFGVAVMIAGLILLHTRKGHYLTEDLPETIYKRATKKSSMGNN